MEGFGPEKLVFLLLIVMLVFGAKRLPEIGSSLGKGIREFKKSVRTDEELSPSVPPQASQLTQPPAAQRIETTQA